MRRIASEIYLMWKQSLRLLLKSRATLAVFVFGMCFLFLLLLFMEEAKEEKSVIYIGAVDEDGTELSKGLLKRICGQELFDVAEGSTEELLELLAKGELAAVCVIKKGYGASIRKGTSRRLVTVYEGTGSQNLTDADLDSGITGSRTVSDGILDGVPLLTDIIAGEMVYDICTSKSFQTYRKLGRPEQELLPALDVTGYFAYVAEYAEQEELAPVFAVHYFDRAGEEYAAPKRTELYSELILAVFAMMTGLLAAYAMMPYRTFRRDSVSGRVRLLPVSGFLTAAGAGLAALCVELLFGALFIGMLGIRDGISTAGLLWMSWYTFLYGSMAVVPAFLMAHILPDAGIYQSGMLLITAVCGVLGCLSIFGGLLLPESVTACIPNSWYIQKMAFYL